MGGMLPACGQDLTLGHVNQFTLGMGSQQAKTHFTPK